MNRLRAPEFAGAQQHISVWAPHAERIVHLLVDGVRVPMTAQADGWWTSPEPLRAGTEYAFSLDGGEARPDPRSLLQPHGPDGVSEVVDLGAYEWQHDFAGRELEGGVIYELHIGTFTPDGTFEAAIERLDYLVRLGVTHVEVMPVNGVPGARNWGYDGVNLYATQSNYGGPHAFQRFVDACHERGLAVILDVVYNHLGPSGNYLPEYGTYFNPAKMTPWGAAVNLDGAGSDQVRRFLLQNALTWFEHFRVDGFRFDAVHEYADTSAVPFLEELAAVLNASADDLGRTVTLIAESDRNDPATVAPRRDSAVRDGAELATTDGGFTGYGMDGQWADDIHHALHVLLTGETQGYYADFADPSALEKTLNTPFFHDGTYSSFRGRRHGRPVAQGTQGWRFIASLQTHDQVGNRAAGDRLSQLVSRDRLACGAALLLTSPYTPMLFMGEEWGASTPWQFFTDHTDPGIAAATSKGRAEEFAAHGWGNAVPDPQELSTFENSRLDWSELDDADGDAAQLLDWYRTLIRLRTTHPELSDPALYATDVERGGFERDGHLTIHRGPFRVVVNLCEDPMEVHGEVVAAWRTVQQRADGVVIPPSSVAILT